MSKEQALEELLKMIKEGNITDYDAELASYRDVYIPPFKNPPFHVIIINHQKTEIRT